MANDLLSIVLIIYCDLHIYWQGLAESLRKCSSSSEVTARHLIEVHCDYRVITPSLANGASILRYASRLPDLHRDMVLMLNALQT